MGILRLFYDRKIHVLNSLRYLIYIKKEFHYKNKRKKDEYYKKVFNFAPKLFS